MVGTGDGSLDSDAEREHVGRLARIGRRLGTFHRRLWIMLTVGLLAIGILIAVLVLRDPTSDSAILENAAAELGTDGDSVTVPDPHEWYYRKELGFWIGQGDRTLEHEHWARADYKYFADYGGSGRIRKEQPRSDSVVPGLPSLVEAYGFYEQLPDDPDAVLDAIHALVEEDMRQPAFGVRCSDRCAEFRNSDWNRAGKSFELITFLLANSNPPDAVQATLFRAMAEIPGVRDVGTVADISGKEVLAVSWFVPDDSQPELSQGDRLQFLIDPATQRYHGWELVHGNGEAWRSRVMLVAEFVETQGEQ